MQPFAEAWHHLGVTGPLSSEQPTGRILIIKTDQQAVVHFEVLCLNISPLQEDGLGQNLSESMSILELLDVVSIEETERTLLHSFFHHVLASLENEASLSLIGWKPTELDNPVLVRLPDGLLKTSLLRHTKSFIDAWKRAVDKSLNLEVVLHSAIEVPVRSSSWIGLQLIVGRANHHIR